MSLLLRRYHSQDEQVSEEEAKQQKAKAKTKAKKSGDVDGETRKD